MKSCSGSTIKLFAKAQEAFFQDRSTVRKKPELENLIFYLTDFLNSWDVNKKEKEL